MQGAIIAVLLLAFGAWTYLVYDRGYDDGFGEHEATAQVFALKTAQADAVTERRLRAEGEAENAADLARAGARIAEIDRRARKAESEAARHRQAATEATATIENLKVVAALNEAMECPWSCRIPELDAQ